MGGIIPEQKILGGATGKILGGAMGLGGPLSSVMHPSGSMIKSGANAMVNARSPMSNPTSEAKGK